MQFVDLSVPLENDNHWAPWWARNRVKYQGRRVGRLAARLLYGIGPKYLRTGLGWANEIIKLSTHGTTHVDAPWHYAPVCEGRPARTIDQLPLDLFFGPGVVLDVRHMGPTEFAGVAEVKASLGRIGHQLSPGDIVLIQTGNDRLLGSRDYFSQGPGVDAEATRWILQQGVRLTGIDAWSWDGSLDQQAKEAKRTKRRDAFWAAHFVGVDKEYCHIERLANLDKLPTTGFTVCAFPLNVKGASAGPARVVALVDRQD